MRSGARRWFDLGFFSLQPSEFAKLAFILAQAHFLAGPRRNCGSLLIFWKALGMMLLPFLLILKEPDLGSALVLLPTGLAMLTSRACPERFLLRLLGGVGILAALFLVDVLFAPPNWQIKLEDYQRNGCWFISAKNFAAGRLRRPERNACASSEFDDSYKVRQALISVGSGGLTGKGWQQGTQNALGFLPPGVAHNDFIFSVIAEEKGFVGSVIVLTLYAVVLFTGIRIAGQARDRLGKMLAVGVVTLLFSHVFINIGMNIRIDARDGRATAAVNLRRVFSARLVDRHGHAAKRVHLSKGLLIMSDRNFSRRRRGGMRFRPSGGLGHSPQKPDREATEARAEAVGRHGRAGKGLRAPPRSGNRARRKHRRRPAAGRLADRTPAAGRQDKRDFREPNLETPAQVEEEKPFEPVPVQGAAQRASSKPSGSPRPRWSRRSSG